MNTNRSEVSLPGIFRATHQEFSLQRAVKLREKGGYMRSLRLVVTLVFVLAVTAVSLSAQTGASTSTVTGTVFDRTGAVVPKAKVELLDLATGITNSTTTGDEDQYAFSAVRPGNYKVTVTAPGFRQSVVSGVRVDVGKAALVNVTLELGQVTQMVEVRAGAATELQTLDASVGNVLGENILASMPTLTRDATSLLMLQPMAISGFNGPGGSGESNVSGGTVAGARADQNTFMVDGGDATSNMEGGGGYNTSFVATPRAVVPTPVESLEELRVATNNPNVTFTRSGGAEVQMVTRRGSNNWHGAAYWYHQNDELNANSAVRNRLGQSRPELRDNRFGGRIGGPIWKDRTFFFVHEEERHFFRGDDFTRLVPTKSMRVGILKFKDAPGAVVPYNLNPVATVDPDTGNLIASSGLDPRNKGISPAILAEWNTLPVPNDFSSGDGLRTAGFTAPVPTTTNEHFAVARLDHKINSKWDFMASYRYSTTDDVPGSWQVDIGGLSPGATKGVPHPTATHPLQPRFLVVGLTGRLTPNLTNEFHFNWLRHWWAWQSTGARTPVVASSLSDTILQIFKENRATGLVPINVDTQRARERTWNGRDYTFIDNITWLKGKHMWQFGGRAQLQRLLHVRDDKVVGGITTPIYYIVKASGFNNIDVSSSFRPPTCSSTLTTNCLRSSDVTNWKRAYISTLGLVDTASRVLTRAPDLTPNPPLTLITHNSNVDSYELHFADTWRMTPSFTFTYGLTWGVQMPPFETNRKDTIMVDVNSGQIISADQLLNAKKLAGLQGKVVNPLLGFVPIEQTGRKYPYDPDYTNLGPRLAAAWNPSFTSGFLGKVLGDRKTVLRGGWSRAFDRVNGVGIVLTPALGLGFGDLAVCVGPDRTAGTSTAGCTGGTDPNSAFRIGVDGNHINIPPLPSLTSPIIPGQGALIPPKNANSLFETRDFRIDPRRQVGGTDMIDFSIQRELPFNMLLEVGYVGRFSRDLYQNIDLNHIPYMFTKNGQTFADAFDKVAAQLQAGVNPANVTAQPWFEAMLGAGGTVSAAKSDTSFFVAHAAGDTWFDLEPSFVTGPMTAFNTQVSGMDWTMSNGYANYHAGFVTLRKRPSHGLAFDLNYTFSKSLDVLGLTQENTDANTDAFNLSRNYAPSLFDRRHTFNLLANYELPFGKGKRFASSGVLDKIVGGWSVSGIYTAASGLPLFVYNSDGDGTEFGSTSFNGDPSGWIPLKPGVITSSRNDKPTVTSSGIGSDSIDENVPNAFANPENVANNFRPPTFADGRLGFGAVRGLFRWNLDFGVAKTTRITERVSTRFDVQFVNAFNHPMFSGGAYYSFEPNSDQADPASFGVLSSQFNSPRFIQIGLRIDF
jgi:hypothetical protein